MGSCEDENQDTDVYFPKSSFEESMLNCQALGGILPFPESQSEAKMQVDLVKNNMENPSEWNVMWVPLKKDFNDISQVYHYTGAWKYYLDKIEPDLLEWAPGQPNGELLESCVGIFTSDDTPAFYDLECSYIGDSLCRFKTVTLFQI